MPYILTAPMMMLSRERRARWSPLQAIARWRHRVRERQAAGAELGSLPPALREDVGLTRSGERAKLEEQMRGLNHDRNIEAMRQRFNDQDRA